MKETVFALLKEYEVEEDKHEEMYKKLMNKQTVLINYNNEVHAMYIDGETVITEQEYKRIPNWHYDVESFILLAIFVAIVGSLLYTGNTLVKWLLGLV